MAKEAAELAFDDPCVVFAMRRESKPFLREFHPQQKFKGSPCWAQFCGPAWLTVLAVECGVGARCAEQAMTWLLNRPVLENVPYQPKLVLSAGFSGGLQADRHVGDVILATEVVDTAGNRWPTTWPGELPEGDWRPPIHRCRILTSNKIIGTPAEKAELGKRFDAAAVDMESATVARQCSRAGVPFGCLRVISDDARSPISPRLAALLEGGRVSPFRGAAAVLRSPGLAAEYWTLAKHTRMAAKQLGKALGEVLTLTLPFGSQL